MWGADPRVRQVRRRRPRPWSPGWCWSGSAPRRHALSFLATGSFDGRVEGIYDLQNRYVQQFGPGDYRPIIPLTYWSYRLMIGCGLLAAAIAAVGLWQTRKGRQPASPWFHRAAVTAIGLPAKPDGSPHLAPNHPGLFLLRRHAAAGLPRAGPDSEGADAARLTY